MEDNNHYLRFFFRAGACYLCNGGGREIAVLDYDSLFVGLDGGASVCVEYGRYRISNFPPRACILIHHLTTEDSYLPLESGWFQLDIHRLMREGGPEQLEPFTLKSTRRWGGAELPGTLISVTPQAIEETPG